MAECLPSVLNLKDLPTVRVPLDMPPLSQIIEVVLPQLMENFEKASMEVVECPDLTKPPFHLAAKGLSGDEKVIDIGSPSYLLPLVNLDKLYDVRDLKQVTESDPLFVVGAGAGPWPYVGSNCELIKNVEMTCDRINNRSHFYKVNPETACQVHGNLPNNDTRFALLANFYTSNGFPGKVLRITCETRKGSLNFVMAIREALAKHFGDKIVGLGGVMLIENGKIKTHVMQDFSKTPLNTETHLNNWLKFYEVSPPLVGLGYLISHDPDLDLRPQHFHLFSEHGLGGHYHYDIEPALVKYTAYFNVAKYLIRIDKPKETLLFGKD